MTTTTTVYVSIGNSDDRLSQVEWSAYVQEFVAITKDYAEQKFGEWYSAPFSAYQNACIAIAVPTGLLGEFRAALAFLRKEYRQDSIAWAVAPETEFI